MVKLGPQAATWLVALLLVSLGANVFLGRLYAGAWLGRGEAPAQTDDAAPANQRPVQAFIRRLIDKLPEAERPAFVAALAPHRPAIMAAGLELHEARLAIGKVLLAEPYSRADLDAAFAELRRRNMAFQATIQAAVADAVEGLTPEGRAALVERSAAGDGP